MGAIAQIVAHQTQARLDVLYLLVEREDVARLRELIAHGFDRVDERLTYTLGWSSWREPPHLDAHALVPARAEDVPALQDIAADAHRDSRFYADPGFEDEQCSRLYRTWIEVSCQTYADIVWTGRDDQGACGYVTCHLEEGSGSIGLVGVAPRAQGQGLATRLLHRALRWCRDEGASGVEVVTQARNIPAQRLYQGAGFKLASRAVWYHRWARHD